MVLSMFRLDRLALFWWFVSERQKVWHRRFVEKRPPPWSDDRILRDYRFTNVYRELDPGTQYVVGKILEFDAPASDKIFNVMLYRLIGRAETHMFVGFQRLSSFDPSYLEQKLKLIRDVQGKPPFTGAYTVCAYRGMGSRDKVENVSRLMGKLRNGFEGLYRRIAACTSAWSAYKALRTAPGFGTFLAYQVLVDLLYPLQTNSGRPTLPFSPNDWAIPGPGAKRGIGMILDDSARTDDLRVMRWLRDNQDQEFRRLQLSFPYLLTESGSAVKISLANIQNCLCEFHKYVKASSGTGRVRRRFVPKPSLAGEQLLLQTAPRVST
jgi:hypothetical protein